MYKQCCLEKKVSYLQESQNAIVGSMSVTVPSLVVISPKLTTRTRRSSPTDLEPGTVEVLL